MGFNKGWVLNFDEINNFFFILRAVRRYILKSIFFKINIIWRV